MSQKSLTALVAGLCIFVGSFAMAQDSPSPRVFHLLRDNELAKRNLEKENAKAEKWDPSLQKGRIDLSLSLGMLDLNKPIFEEKQIIYKYDDQATYWGDVNIQGAAAFNPVLRMGYSLQRWFVVEAIGGLSFADYTSNITNRHRRKNEPGAPVDFEEPALGEYDAEARSLLTVQFGANAVIYPFAITGQGRGRVHPYLTAGAGRIWYDMNSNYNDGSSASNDLNFGGGIRLLADSLISIRIEALFHRNTLQWTPVKNFLSLHEGTLLVPLEEFPTNEEDGSFEEVTVSSYKSMTMNTLNLSIGFEGTF